MCIKDFWPFRSTQHTTKNIPNFADNRRVPRSVVVPGDYTTEINRATSVVLQADTSLLAGRWLLMSTTNYEAYESAVSVTDTDRYLARSLRAL